jgi:hypothetical protein
MIWGWSRMQKRKIDLLKKITPKKTLLPYLIIALFVVLLSAYFNVWPNPVGDDAYLHAGKALFVRNNFPNINWYPNWYLGFDIFESYPPTYYFLIALANFVTGISITQLMVIFLFLSMFLLGVGVYKFSKYMDMPWYTSLGFSLTWLSLPIVWGHTITGGAYLRSFAAPFYIFSLLALYRHVLSVNSGKEDHKTFLLLVFILAFTFLLHEAVAFFTAVTVFLVYLLALKGVRQKIKTIMKVFIPVSGLVLWFYLPALRYSLVFKPIVIDDLTLAGFEEIGRILNPILLPLTLILSGIFILNLFKDKRTFTAHMNNEKRAFLLVFLLLSLYFFLFGWFPMPENAYIMAAYDYRTWFGISLTLFLIVLSGLLCVHFKIIPPNKLKYNLTSTSKYLLIISILMIITAFAFSLPLVDRMDLNPDDPTSWGHGLSQTLGEINKEIPDNFRSTAITRRIYAMQPYEYPELDLAGGRQSGSYHTYYDSLFRERVLIRFNEDCDFYTEEKLTSRSEVSYAADNYFSSMFWMDWFGVNGIAVAPWEQNLRTLNEYYQRPQYFNTLNMGEGSTYIKYNESSPILISTNAPVVGIINNETIYKALFLTLGELNINSQKIIPVKLEVKSLEHDLQFVDTVFVDSTQFNAYEKTLKNYVRTGGHLVIMDYKYDNVEVKKANLVESGIIFNTFATPLNYTDISSEVVAKTEEGAVISRSKLGAGFITCSSVSLQELYEDASSVASAVLGIILIPDFNIDSSLPKMNTLQVSWIVNASARVITLDNEKVLEYKPTQNGYKQINFRVFFEKSMNTSALGFIQFELWNDGKTKDMTLCLTNSRNLNYLAVNLSDSQWTGWRTFSIPLASFIKKQDIPLLREFDGADLVVVNQENLSAENEEHTLKIKNIGYYRVVSTPNHRPLEYEWVQPNLLKTSLTENNTVTRLLWKESFDENWQINTNSKIVDSRNFYAGPGVILVCIPENVKDVTFYMPPSEVRTIGAIVSTITLLTLILIEPLQKKFKQTRHVPSGSIEQSTRIFCSKDLARSLYTIVRKKR